jgi:HD-GYP domain-containing protein (c-di-GMP phosphodiesterase class II)
MLIEEREIRVASLRPGMYVSRLDRDWIGTPFLLQGFMIESQDDIVLLAKYCRHVVVDIVKSENSLRQSLQRLDPSDSIEYAAPDIAAIGQGKARAVTVKVEEELPRAREAADKAYTATRDLIAGLRNGQGLSEQAVDQAVTPLVESVLRNPDAYFWLETLRRHDRYTYSHAMNCCALMATFGRHLGFSDETLRDMATGGLLLDIGKTAIPEVLLESVDPLSESDRDTVQTHPAHGLRLYDATGAGNPYVREIIQTHHEREDGSGYPQRLAGDAIPLFGRIAGIVDSYDAMTSDRPYRAPISKYDALQRMYRERGSLFHGDLVEQFVQCLGVYPVGTLVELSTGEVAVVMAQNPIRRLFPQVMLLTDADKRLRNGFESLDLRDTLAAGSASAQISIRRCLHAGAYGLDPKALYL